MPFEKGKIPEGAKPFEPGKSGNPAGRPKKLPDIDELLADVLGDEKEGKTAAHSILMALEAKAAKGDVRAAEVLLDRAWGKPKQSHELTGKDGSEFTLILPQIVINVLKPGDVPPDLDLPG